MNPGCLGGKVAVITGGCSGIGLATVEHYLAEGARVVVADIEVRRGEALEQRFRGRLRFCECDVTREPDIAAAMTLAEKEFGRLDVLFNNAGIGGADSTVANTDANGWDYTFAVLLRAVVLGMKHAVPIMLKGGGGSIINTASVAGLQAGWAPTAYSTAKAGVIHLTRITAAELSPQGIRVNAICPGLIATPIFGTSMGLSRDDADRFTKQVEEAATKCQPIARPGLPKDIAAGAVYLASDVSAFVTGTHLVVDGGITIGPRHAWSRDTPPPLAELMEPMPQQHVESAR